MTSQRIVLTDVSNGIWIDEFGIGSSDELSLAGSDAWSISKGTVRGGLSDGVDVIEINNGALSLSVLPTRGMGLWRGTYHDLTLGWQSPVAQPVNPAFVNLNDRSGLGWLTGFNELLCRCGLASNGAPGTDTVLDNNGNPISTELTLHGRIANTPAHYVETLISTEGSGILSVTGVVDETMMFGPCLQLRSTLATAAGSNRVTIDDRITNLGSQPAELQLLYHTNIGEPILGEGSRFVAPLRRVAPRDTRAADGITSFSEFSGPEVGYVEQVYFMQLAADEAGETTMLLRNSDGDCGVSLSFQTEQLPCVSIWKNTQAREDGYVAGLEPATNYPNLKTFEREQGRVVTIAPGASYHSRLELAAHDTASSVSEIEARIAAIQSDHRAQVDDQPAPEFSPT